VYIIMTLLGTQHNMFHRNSLSGVRYSETFNHSFLILLYRKLCNYGIGPFITEEKTLVISIKYF